jgi:hypothetical protein
MRALRGGVLVSGEVLKREATRSRDRVIPFTLSATSLLRATCRFTGLSILEMARLPVELLEIIVYDYYDLSHAAKPLTTAALVNTVTVPWNAKPAWADIAPLLNASRIIRKLAMQRWLSTLVAIPPSGGVGPTAVLAFPYPRFAQHVRWVRG